MAAMDLTDDDADLCTLCARPETDQYPLVFCPHDDCKKFCHTMCHDLRLGGTEGHMPISKEDFYYDHQAFHEGPAKAEEMKQHQINLYDSARAASNKLAKVGHIARDVGFHAGAASALTTGALAVGTEAIKATFISMGRTNLIVSGVIFAGSLAVNSVRWYRGEITKYEFGSNIAKVASRTAGGLGGFAAGAALGSLAGPIGTLLGGIIGGILGGTLTAYFGDSYIDKLFPGPEELARRAILEEGMTRFGLNKDVTLAEIDSEFRAFARIYHPDRRTGDHATFCHLSALRDVLIEYVCERDGVKGAPRLSENSDGRYIEAA